MVLPHNLLMGYTSIKTSSVVTMKNNSEEALLNFQKILNRAQPRTPTEYKLYKFVKDLYYGDMNRFLDYIKDTKFECLVLWTVTQNIVNFLGLRDVIFIEWTGKETLYHVKKYTGTGRNNNTQHRCDHPLAVNRHTKPVEIVEIVEPPVIVEIVEPPEIERISWADISS